MRSRCTTLLALLLVCGGLLLSPLAFAESGEASQPKAKPHATPPGAAAARTPPGPARPGSLRALKKRLAELIKSIEQVIAEARRDPDEALIDIYLAYSPKELKLRKRPVDAEVLLRIMVDPKNKPDLREKARAALLGGTLRGDIDLSRDHKKAGMTNRAWFCRHRVADHLKDDGREARQLTNKLLTDWYRPRGISGILGYKYDEKKTWGRAITAWKKELKKRK